MKVRKGFVSNSSSSSFVVSLRTAPISANDLKQLLNIKDDDDDIESYYPDFSDSDEVSVDEVMQYIFSQMMDGNQIENEFHFSLSDGDGRVGAVAEFGNWFKNVSYDVKSNH